MIKLILLVLWNGFVFGMYGEDKRRFKAGLPRASENMFVVASLFMGAFGTLAGMVIFHQRLRSAKLVLIMPFALLLNLAVAMGILTI